MAAHALAGAVTQKSDPAEEGSLIKERWVAYSPFLESRVPGVAPWRALNLGLDLQMT